MQITCKKCNTKITDISVTKTLSFRADFQNIGGVFTEYDREYYGPIKVHTIIYKCPCKPLGTQIKHVNLNIINDFIRDSNEINEDDLLSTCYEDLLIQK